MYMRKHGHIKYKENYIYLLQEDIKGLAWLHKVHRELHLFITSRYLCISASMVSYIAYRHITLHVNILPQWNTQCVYNKFQNMGQDTNVF